MKGWFLKELYQEKNYQPQPRFALIGTFSWMISLSIILDNEAEFNESIRTCYQNVSRRNSKHKEDILALDNLLRGYHYHSGLVCMASCEDPVSISRSAIITWYYSIYSICRAMIAAESSTLPETHTKVAKVWHNQFIKTNLVVDPFNMSLDSLIKKKNADSIALYQKDLTEYKGYPKCENEARWILSSYLNGTAKKLRETQEKQIKKDKNFNWENFVPAPARKFRDEHLARQNMNFLNQSFRYRGKANYRDSIFLCYGDINSDRVKKFIQSLILVSYSFQKMGVSYLSKRIDKKNLNSFIEDFEGSVKISKNNLFLPTI